MIIPTLTASAAQPYLRALLDGRQPELPLERLVEDVGTPPRGNIDNAVQGVRDQLMALIRGLREGEVGRFDAEGAAIVHKGLGPLSVRIASNRGFWRFLACGPLVEITRWRAPSNAVENFGIGKIWRAVPERLWFRGSMAFDAEAADAYELVRRGGVDFWESGLIRVLYSSNPVLARALVRFQFPEDGEFRGSSYRPATLRMEGIRELWKRLRHFDSVLNYSDMDVDRARRHVEEVAQDLPRSHGEFQD